MLLGALARGRLTDDIPSIVRAAESFGVVSAIDLQGSQTLPFSWHADVFLEAAASASGIRRGRVLHLRCAPATVSGACRNWEAEQTPSWYVLVESDPGPQAARRPIRLEGRLTDAQVTSLVAFVRTSPHPPRPPGPPGTRSFSMGIQGEYPITDVRVDDEGIVWVWLTTGPASAEQGRFEQTRGGWVLLGAVWGVG